MELKLKMPSFKRELGTFTVMLLATFIGVFLAVKFANTRIENNEKNGTVKLLNTAIILLTDLKNQTFLIDNSYEPIADSATHIVQYDAQFELLKTILSNPLFPSHVSDFSHGKLYLQLNQLQRFSLNMNHDAYAACLLETILLLELEKEYQEGKLSVADLMIQFALRKTKIDSAFSKS